MIKSVIEHCSYIRKITSMILLMSFACCLCSCSADGNDFDGVRFAKTKTISVLSDSSDPMLEQYIHNSVLEDCNIDVRFVPDVFYYQEYGVVPDVSYTFDSNILNTYYRMDTIINLSPYLNEYELTNLKNMTCCYDIPSDVWYLNSSDTDPEAKVTFIREDWLEMLGLDAPSTRQELYDCLIAFRDNAEMLLGNNATEMIPFFIDSEPYVSCKPLFDSFYDVSISEEDFYEHGYCRATQDGYISGLEVLNEWYIEGLLPNDFNLIMPESKESYEPIENGYVGAFCADYDYLYKNGDNSFINALHDNCGDEANYIAVNTFENANGDYTYWPEDYLKTPSRYIYIPTTCTEPLACLVYLDWISDPDNIQAMIDNSSDASNVYNYLLTSVEHTEDSNVTDNPYACLAKLTAEEVQYFTKPNNLCVRYGPAVFEYDTAAVGFKKTYPDSLKIYSCEAIMVSEGEFDDTSLILFDEYVNSGAKYIYDSRIVEWHNVIVEGNLTPW